MSDISRCGATVGCRAWLGRVGLALVLFAMGAAATGPAGAAAGAPAARPSATSVPGQLLVRYRPGVSAAEAAGVERGASATRVRTLDRLGVHVLAVPAAATDRVLAALAADPTVDYAEADQVASATATPNDERWPRQWSPVTTRATAAWDVTTGSSSVVVAVLDTGVDLTQPDLQGKLTSGRDIVNNDTDPTDDHGHGTMVSGIVGAASNNTIGVTSYCWGCRVMPVKVLGADGAGAHSNIAEGITWAADQGARVINMSLGGSSSSTTLANAVRYAHDRGVVLVASAGNSGTTALNYPAAYGEVIGVAGTDSTDALYSWSNRGSWVKVAAPGINLATGRNGWYGDFAGTSSAAPVVAGIAGLAASAKPSATKAEIEQALYSSAKAIGPSVAHGRVDASGTLTALTGGAPPPPNDPPPPPPPTSTTTSTFSGSLTTKVASRSFPVTTGAGTLSATLTFSKVSSLTLRVVAADGTVVAQSSGGSPVTLSATTAAGPYTLVVSGASRASFTLTVTHPTP